MSKQAFRLTIAVLSLALMIATASGQSNLTAKANNFQPQPSATKGADNETDRVRDGLIGPVRRVRTEVVKLSNAGGKTVEDSKRTVLETAEYDLKGSKTQNRYFPVEGATLTGREVYKYDEKGNISEMTLVSADGSLVSKEVYKYEYDSVGNWVKMTTSVAVVENGKIGFEPSEMTYRTIFYYLDASMAKMLEPGASPSPVSAPPPSELVSSKPSGSAVNDTKSSNSLGASVKQPENRSTATLPPSTSLDKMKVSSVQPLTPDFRGVPLDPNKRMVVTDNDAPPAPRSLLKPVSGGVLNGKALSLPTPVYPEVARRMRTEGVVQVEVVVDENGKVVSARALSGPGMLRDAAVKAASLAHFSPTKLSGMPVKVTGMINYNFSVPK
jgi:TonB family protein